MMVPVIAGWRRAGRSWSGIRLLAGEEGADHRVGRDNGRAAGAAFRGGGPAPRAAWRCRSTGRRRRG